MREGVGVREGDGDRELALEEGREDISRNLRS